jgi:hypothetical protein
VFTSDLYIQGYRGAAAHCRARDQKSTGGASRSGSDLSNMEGPDTELVGNSRGQGCPVLEQNKDHAKENDGGKANYDLLAIPIKQGSVSIARHKVYADRVFRANKKTARRRSLCS